MATKIAIFELIYFFIALLLISFLLYLFFVITTCIYETRYAKKCYASVKFVKTTRGLLFHFRTVLPEKKHVFRCFYLKLKPSQCYSYLIMKYSVVDV